MPLTQTWATFIPLDLDFPGNDQGKQSISASLLLVEDKKIRLLNRGDAT